jgi:2-methylisocitrate lyase-like PEP mutase family enzyme
MESAQLEKATLLNALHVPGEPLVVVNVWDAITAKIVSEAPGVTALATASHSISNVRGLQDGEGITVDEAITAATIIAQAVDIPVSADFEKGYASDAAGVAENVRRLIEESGVVGPIVINERADTLAGGGDWDDTVVRANTYLQAGADVIFFLGLKSEDLLKRAVDEVKGRLSVFGSPGGIPLGRLAELGVSRVSFGPGTLGLTLAALQRAAATLVTLGEYPDDLGFKFEL